MQNIEDNRSSWEHDNNDMQEPKGPENENEKDLNDVAKNVRQEIDGLKESEMSEEKINKIQNAVTEMEGLHKAFLNGKITGGEFHEALRKYKDMVFENHAPREAPKMLKVINFPSGGTHGAFLSREGIGAGSYEFKKFLTEETRVQKFLDEFYAGKSIDYADFKRVVGKYENDFDKHGFCVKYYKFEQSGNTPALIALEIWDEEIKKDYADRFFKAEEGYDEKLAVFKKVDNAKKLFANTLETLEKTSKISETIQETRMNSEELKAFLGVDDLFGNYEKIKSVVELMAKAKFQKGNEIYATITGGINTENDPIYIPQNTEHLREHDAARLWSVSQRKMPSEAVKNYLAGVRMVIKGKVITCIFPPYMKYEDFEGGSTHRYPENNICEIIDIEQQEGGITIKYMDQNKKEREMTFITKE